MKQINFDLYLVKGKIKQEYKRDNQREKKLILPIWKSVTFIQEK